MNARNSIIVLAELWWHSSAQLIGHMTNCLAE
jgi:hypothetical protein